MKKMLFLSVLLLFLVSKAIAQSNITVSGVVTDGKTGETLIGVTVQVKGESNGVITGVDGFYSIPNVSSKATLIFSSMGMKTVEEQVRGRKSINITMLEDNVQLDEVVVIGYGTAKKRDLTGSIVSIKGDDLKNMPAHSPLSSMQGLVPGLNIINNGSAGSTPTIRLRGVATLQASTNPLFVVDGMLVDNIDFVNPADIASMEVLKDPSSLAIFGVQGANGVIIVTTRKADEGKTSVSYNAYAGAQVLQSRDRVKLTDADEFTMLYNEKLRNEDPSAAPWIPDLTGKGTDWVSEVTRPALITNHTISVSNSSKKGSSLFSLGYFKQDGIIKYNSYQRINARFAGDYNLNKHIKVGTNINLSRWDSDPANVSIENAVKAIPTYAPYAPKEDWNDENIGSHYTPSPSIQKDVANPVACYEIGQGNSDSHGYRLVSNIYAEFKFLKDFTFKATGYADLGLGNGYNYTPGYDVNNETSASSHRHLKTSFGRNSSENSKYQADFILNYNKKINKHSIGATAGYTASVTRSEGFSASVDSLLNSKMWNIPEDFWTLNVGDERTYRASDSFSETAFISYLARVNYSYDNKYLLTATFRADGSSKFSPNKRWGYFPSVGLGWVMSEENFIKNIKQIDFLKLKASWGQLGNDKIGNYLWFPQINPKGQQVVVDGQTYYIPTVSNLVDENIHWEVMEGIDVGLEGKFFNSRLSVDLGYFVKTTRDLLAKVAPPVSVGAGYAITNAGSIRNQGFEFMLGWRDKIQDFSYGVSFNGGTLKNEVLSLGTDNSDIVSGSYHRTSVGHPVGSMYGYVQEGIFQNQEEIDNYGCETPWKLKPGDIRYKDLDGDGKISDKDRTFIGNNLPRFTYGISLNCGYKNFDLMVNFNGVAGRDIINAKKLASYSEINYYEFTLNRWHGEGTSNFEPILDNTRAHNYLPSTNLLEDGSYFRIRDIQLGYNLPKKALSKLKLNTFRIYVNAQNPLTFKHNSGFTPEVGSGILSGGVDFGSTHPMPATYTAGVSLGF